MTKWQRVMNSSKLLSIFGFCTPYLMFLVGFHGNQVHSTMEDLALLRHVWGYRAVRKFVSRMEDSTSSMPIVCLGIITSPQLWLVEIYMYSRFQRTRSWWDRIDVPWNMKDCFSTFISRLGWWLWWLWYGIAYEAEQSAVLPWASRCQCFMVQKYIKLRFDKRGCEFETQTLVLRAADVHATKPCQETLCNRWRPQDQQASLLVPTSHPFRSPCILVRLGFLIRPWVIF